MKFGLIAFILTLTSLKGYSEILSYEDSLNVAKRIKFFEENRLEKDFFKFFDAVHNKRTLFASFQKKQPSKDLILFVGLEPSSIRIFLNDEDLSKKDKMKPIEIAVNQVENVGQESVFRSFIMTVAYKISIPEGATLEVIYNTANRAIKFSFTYIPSKGFICKTES